MALGNGDWEGFSSHIKKSTRLFEHSRGGCYTPVLYSLKAVSDACDGNTINAVQSLQNAEFLITGSRKSWRAAHEMSKALVLKFSKGKGEDILINCLKKSREDYANIAATLYEELGYHERVAFITEELMNK